MTAQTSLPHSGVSVVQLPAEVDLASAAGVADQLLSSLDGEGVHLVVDATMVTFMDSSGVNALVRARGRTERLGGSLHVVSVAPAVVRVLQLTQLDRRLGLVPTLDDALRCLSRPGTIHTCDAGH